MSFLKRENVTIKNGDRRTTIPIETYNNYKNTVYDGWEVVEEPKKETPKEFGKMSKPELLAEVKKLNIEIPEKATKTDLVNILNKANESE